MAYTFHEWEKSELDDLDVDSSTSSEVKTVDMSELHLESSDTLKNQGKLITMCTFTITIFFAEMIVGYVTNSLALITDAFHMLSDFVSLLVALLAFQMMKKQKSKTMTYGWVRTEILGGFVNGVLLIALCINVFTEAIERMFEPPEIEHPILLLVVASIGLAFNIIGLFLFSGYHQNSSSHSHSHKDKSVAMHSVFLHVMGDALGSVSVIASSLFIWLTDFSWRFYVDPIVSLIFSAILIKSCIHLIKETSLIILQGVPTNVNTQQIHEKVSKVGGVLGIHDLHVWQLDIKRIICTIHISITSSQNFMDLAQEIKNILHGEGIHSVTIQPEIVQDVSKSESVPCFLQCEEMECRKRLCCSDQTSLLHT